jgi:hypothetical protein
MSSKRSSEERAMRAAERAAERRRSTDWFYAKYSTFEESEEAMLDDAARMSPAERLFLAFELSARFLGIEQRLPRSEWPVKVMRFNNDEGQQVA